MTLRQTHKMRKHLSVVLFGAQYWDDVIDFEALVRQVAAPVQWDAVVRRLASEGVRTYVEVGPGTVLAGLVKKIDRDATVVSVEDPAGVEALDAVLSHA